MYQLNEENGYIISIVAGVDEGNITKEQYDSIMSVIQNAPTAPDGFGYRLKTDLTWELYEQPMEFEDSVE